MGFVEDDVAGTRESILEDQPALLPKLDMQLAHELGISTSNPDAKKIRKIWEHCARDPEYFIFGGFVRTFDEHDTENRRKPFPRKKYLYRALQHIHDTKIGDVCAISKSRQMLITWLMCAYAVWEARFHEHSRVMIQSKKADDAYALVYRNNWYQPRCGFIERALPPWLRLRGTKGIRGELIYPNGSSIWGIPQGPDMFRSYTATLVICDEACFQPEFEDAYKAALPMCKGGSGSTSGGRIVLVTTAASNTFYAKLVEEADEEAA
jgi:hypothetical protein